MDQAITIHVSETLLCELAERGARLGKSVEQLAEDAVLERYSAPTGDEEAASALPEDPMLAVLRAQGMLATPHPSARPPSNPAPASAAAKALLTQLGDEASDALTSMGQTLADVVER